MTIQTRQLSILYLFSVCMQSCAPLSFATSDHVPAPSIKLPCDEILRLQGITSIHFVEYDSVIVNGNPSEFTPSEEYYLEKTRSKRVRFITKQPWLTDVLDLNAQLSWHYDSNIQKLTYNKQNNLSTICDDPIRFELGSFLKPPVRYLRTEYIINKLCDVFTDTTGALEWVWTEHRLPIQRLSAGSPDMNVYVIGIKQMRQIEINVQFPDSLFSPQK